MGAFLLPEIGISFFYGIRTEALKIVSVWIYWAIEWSLNGPREGFSQETGTLINSLPTSTRKR